MSMINRLLLLACTLALLGGATVSNAFGDAKTVPNPTVFGPIEGGVWGYPWNKSLFPLEGKGYAYTEQEFFFSGNATDLSSGVSAPYESRMLVRLPRDRKK